MWNISPPGGVRYESLDGIGITHAISPCGFLSIVMFPLMAIQTAFSFGTYDVISVLLSVIPLILGVVALRRMEGKVVAMTGVILSASVILCDMSLAVVNGM